MFELFETVQEFAIWLSLVIQDTLYHLVLPSTRHRYAYCLVAVFDPTPPGLDSILAIPLVCHAMLLSYHAADYCC